jgi:Tol biopolymer transport system component
MQTPETPLHRASLGPDGRTIYYSSYQDAGNISAIIAYDIRSRRTREIWRGEGKVSRPIPSPDGQWLAVEVPQSNGSGTKLAIMPATGGEMRELVVSNSGGDFTWAPDSKQILYAKVVLAHSDPSSWQELWTVPVDGGPPKNLNLQSRLMWLLTIHPDGDRIAYSTHNSREEIWVMENFLPEGEPRRDSK